jgi:putative alpha-1,2-mannosidase
MAEQIGYVPRCRQHRENPGSMIGTPADIVITETYLKGIRGFDIEKAYQYLTQSAYSPYNMRKDFSDYVSLGYVPGDVSNTVEPAHEDWALANLAHELGKDGDEAIFRGRSLNYKNLWDPSVRYLRGRNSDGSWYTPFVTDSWSEPYCEGMRCQWTSHK